MGWNIPNEEKLVTGDDENIGDVEQLLNEMEKEDRKKGVGEEMDKVAKKLNGDESNDDDLSEDEDEYDAKDKGDEGDVQHIYNSHIDDSTKYGYRLSQIRLVVFLIRGDKEGGSRKHRCVIEVSFRTELTRMDRKNAGTEAKKEYIKECLVRASRIYQPFTCAPRYLVSSMRTSR